MLILGIGVGSHLQQTTASATGSGPEVFMFDSVRVMAKQGDLLQEKVDCIVIITNVQLDLSTGGSLSNNILTTCGRSILEELQDKKDEMKQKNICSTIAPRLLCKRIIFVQPKRLDDTVKLCLELAESLKQSIVGIPTMEDEINKDITAESAKQMVKGVRQFVKTKPANVQEVRFVLFKPDHLPMFQSAVEKASDSKSFWSYLLFISKKTNDSQTTKSATKPVAKSVTFHIYSLSQDVNNNVKKKIDTCLEEEMKTDTFRDSGIQSLGHHEEAELIAMMNQCHVHAEIDRRKNFIEITGIKDNVYNASKKIQTFLRDISEMHWVEQVVQWYAILVEQDGEKVEPYERDENAIIEKAFKKKEKQVTYFNRQNKRKYIIDFDQMVETPENDPSDVVKVLRRDRVKGDGAFDIPLSWAGKQGNINVVVLDRKAQECIDIESKFIASAGQLQLTVQKIERIQNITLWQQYHTKKKEMDGINTGQTNERNLWHGTPEAAVDSINVHGFNRSYCGKNATLHGDGVYFAVNAEYSCSRTYAVPDGNGVQRVYYCRVLTGDYTLGAKGMRVAPENPKRGTHCIFNSVVDNILHPNMFVVFHDTQAYPEYLIYFKRN